MRAYGRIHRQLAWLALCALLLGTIAPAMNQWLGRTQAVAGVKVRSLSETPRVALQDNAKRSPDSRVADQRHCPACLQEGDLPFLAGLDSPAAWYVSLVPLSPPRWVEVNPRWRWIRSAHLTRAPPAFS